MNVNEKLKAVQVELKAPKNLYNKFGGYSYRNAEGILEAVKPLMAKYNFAILVTDFVCPKGSRYYVQATATFLDCESGEKIETQAEAREADAKKGMDEAQITGAASSYARKYALNGLLALDDTKDADSEEFKETAENKAKTELVVNEENKNDKIDAAEVELLKSESIRTGTTSEFLKKHFKVKNISDLTKVQYQAAMDKLTKLPDVKQEEK